MAVTVVFDMPGCTQQQYEDVMRGLDALGLTQPSGRLHHISSPTPQGWLVVDVWASETELDDFARALMPLLDQAGLGGTAPAVHPVHNLLSA